ncbi:hypothetical protein F4826_004279 [Rahnella inusitata]|nr:hypothetical protein [Rahnella inusitata]
MSMKMNNNQKINHIKGRIAQTIYIINRCNFQDLALVF